MNLPVLSNFQKVVKYYIYQMTLVMPIQMILDKEETPCSIKILQSRGIPYPCEQMEKIYAVLYRILYSDFFIQEVGSRIQGQKETGSRIRIGNTK